MSDRKKDHIQLAFDSQTLGIEQDKRFIYEPLLSAHPAKELKEFTFLNKQIKTPIWASSMTGGTEWAKKINENIARVCNDFGMGMGLGSCRILLESNEYFEDFNVRKYIGDNLPLYANLGIAQIEQLLSENKTDLINKLVDKLKADGLIIHVNPLQEWFQPEGNIIIRSPFETLENLLEKLDMPLIVKEVGQGMGMESLKSLLSLPLAAIEFGAFGGTNFSMVEMNRAEMAVREAYRPFAYIGQTATDMLNNINDIVANHKVECEQLIISGGIKTFLDGYYHTEKSNLTAVFGMASTILRYAKSSYEELHQFIAAQIKGLSVAKAFLHLNKNFDD